MTRMMPTLAVEHRPGDGTYVIVIRRQSGDLAYLGPYGGTKGEKHAQADKELLEHALLDAWQVGREAED